ncbi:YncE family protein [Pseudomonas gingeri]|uniref:YncE family protein n=1 Tax=Pseudomonas gingeri TaxID=117681 RepID=UPI0015A3000A|nr:YncE family protein [Pseudomonas gingeri]NWA25083.1 YncE family protein [Pseudomonas gingeri]NWD71914.1 YncE family protein [Pseudomonas gingeri]
MTETFSYVQMQGNTMTKQTKNDSSTGMGYEIIELARGAGPRGIALNSDGTRAFVCNFPINTVSVINLVTKRIIADIPVGANPYYAAYDPNRNRCYITCLNTPVTVFVIDEQRVIKEIVGSPSLLQYKRMTVDPINKRLYVTRPYALEQNANIIVIDTDTDEIIASIEIASGQLESSIAVDPVKHRAYVPISYSRENAIIQAIDTQTYKFLELGPWISGEPRNAVLSPDRDLLYVAGARTNTSIVDTQTASLVRSIHRPGEDINLSPKGDRAYFSYYYFIKGENWCALHTVDTSTGELIGNHLIARHVPFEMVLSPDGKYGYAPGRSGESSRVLVFDISSFSTP